MNNYECPMTNDEGPREFVIRHSDFVICDAFPPP